MSKQPAPSGAEAAATSAQKHAPAQWASECFPASVTGRIHSDRWKHSAAEALHGWTLNAHHTGAEMQLTRAEYDGAIAAACSSNPVPFAAAKSEFLKTPKGA